MRRNLLQFRLLTLLLTASFVLLGIVAPACHRHHAADGGAAASAALHRGGAAGERLAASQCEISGHDDCPLCDWLALSYTPAPVAATALVLFCRLLPIQLPAVRLESAGGRPLPRLHLRGPPSLLS